MHSQGEIFKRFSSVKIEGEKKKTPLTFSWVRRAVAVLCGTRTAAASLETDISLGTFIIARGRMRFFGAKRRYSLVDRDESNLLKDVRFHIYRKKTVQIKSFYFS